VSFVVVRLGRHPALAQGQAGLAAIKGLYLAFLIAAQNQRAFR